MAPRILIRQTSPLRNLIRSLLNTLLLEAMFLMVTGRSLKMLAPLTEIETSLALRTATGALARPGNNSRLSGIPRFDSKIFCESAITMTLETASNMHKNAEFYEAE